MARRIWLPFQVWLENRRRLNRMEERRRMIERKKREWRARGATDIAFSGREDEEPKLQYVRFRGYKPPEYPGLRQFWVDHLEKANRRGRIKHIEKMLGTKRGYPWIPTWGIRENTGYEVVRGRAEWRRQFNEAMEMIRNRRGPREDLD